VALTVKYRNSSSEMFYPNAVFVFYDIVFYGIAYLLDIPVLVRYLVPYVLSREGSGTWYRYGTAL
jgi:hypothetical protein